MTSNIGRTAMQVEKPRTDRWLHRLVSERGGLLAVSVLVVYLVLAPTHVVDADNAELATLGTLGGIAHPPGYPLYLMWLRAWSWLPATTPAHATAIATVFLATALVIVLHAACRSWGARPAAASITVAIYAAGPFVLQMHVQAEVFALNGLVGALIIWLSAKYGPVRGARRGLALAFIAGLGMSNHLTIVLLAPIGLLGVARALREQQVRRIELAAGMLAAFALGLTPYGYLFLTTENLLSWPQPTTFGELFDILIRREYGVMSVGVSGEGERHVLANQAALLTTLGRSWLWLPLLLGLVAIFVRIRQERDGEPRPGWWMLALAFALVGPGLVAVFDVAPQGFGLYTVRRYHLLAVLVFAVPIAIGFDWLADRLRPSIGLLLPPFVFVAGAVSSAPHVSAEHSPAVEAACRNLLDTLPERAVMIGSGDEFHAGTRYLQLARGVRPDVTYVHWRAMGTRWYRERIERRGIPVGDLAGPAASVELARRILASGVPLFVDRMQGNVLRTYPSYPYGLVMRVMPHGAPLPTLDQVVAMNRDLYARFDLAYPTPSRGDLFPRMVHERYAATWRQLADALRAVGRVDEASAALELARALAPEH